MEKARNNRKKNLIICMMLWCFFTFFSGCKSLKPGMLPSESILFRSEDYLFYKLQGNENTSNLARRFLGDADKKWIIEQKNKDVLFEQGSIIVIPLKYENIGGIEAEGYQVVPILCYHQFGKECKSKLCIQEYVFEQQIRYLKENDYFTITPEMLIAFLEYREPLPSQAILISVDDGYRSAYDIAFPILKKYGYTATIYVYTDFVGVSKSALTWDQLKEMKANGFEIGSHTISHSDLTQKFEGETDGAYMDRIERELAGSKKIIDYKLNQNTISLAYPYGRYNKTVKEIANRVGYKLAVTVKSGGNPFFGDSLALNRKQILSHDNRNFISNVNTIKNF